MTETTRKKKAPRRTKVRALQPIFDDNRLIEEGEVFMFTGNKLPSKEICVPVDERTPVGKAPPEADDPNASMPWTTTGFVNDANRAKGRGEYEHED